jgi:hypothetical protein
LKNLRFKVELALISTVFVLMVSAPMTIFSYESLPTAKQQPQNVMARDSNTDNVRENVRQQYENDNDKRNNENDENEGNEEERDRGDNVDDAW